MKKPYYFIGSLEKASKILKLLAEFNELSVSEIARKLGMHRSAVHRFLATLKSLGFLDQSENSNYRLSFMLFELGIKATNRLEVRQIIHPFLVDLRTRHEETANLGVVDGLDLIYIDKVESTHLLRMDLAIGCRVPSYCTALGKTILANRSENELEELFRGAKLQRRTPNTFQGLRELLRHLYEIRQRGYAIDNEENCVGIRCLAVPIFDYTEKCMAAISLAGPTVRMTDHKIGQMRQDLINVGKEISSRLGSTQSRYRT